MGPLKNEDIYGRPAGVRRGKTVDLAGRRWDDDECSVRVVVLGSVHLIEMERGIGGRSEGARGRPGQGDNEA